jgi:hypothetical protein
MKTFQTLKELAACAGQTVATSDWIPITQEQVNQFAEATGDHQWIHVDVEKAKKGPFGGPIAHGFLTLSLLPLFFESTITVTESAMGVNYGLNKSRRLGSRLRARPIEHRHIAERRWTAVFFRLRWSPAIEYIAHGQAQAVLPPGLNTVTATAFGSDCADLRAWARSCWAGQGFPRSFRRRTPASRPLWKSRCHARCACRASSARTGARGRASFCRKAAQFACRRTSAYSW